MVTEDRKTLGLFDRMTVAENITIRRLPDLTIGPLIDPRAERRAVSWSIKELAIKTADGGVPVTSLSGGNQQKCILARWLLIEPKVLLLDEPTRGIDVGAKAEIYALIRKLAREGRAIIMTSSELPELLAVSDRIIVLCEGRMTAEIPRALATEENIMHAATAFLDRSKKAGRATYSLTNRFHCQTELVMRLLILSVIVLVGLPIGSHAADFHQISDPGNRPACRPGLLCGDGGRCERRPEARRHRGDRRRGCLV